MMISLVCLTGQQHQFRGLMPRTFFTDLGFTHQRKPSAAAVVGGVVSGVSSSGGGNGGNGGVPDYTSGTNNSTTFTIKFPPTASISSTNSTPEVPNAITYPTDASGWTSAYGSSAVGTTSYSNLAQSAYADITGEPFTSAYLPSADQLSTADYFASGSSAVVSQNQSGTNYHHMTASSSPIHHSGGGIGVSSSSHNHSSSSPTHTTSGYSTSHHHHNSPSHHHHPHHHHPHAQFYHSSSYYNTTNNLPYSVMHHPHYGSSAGAITGGSGSAGAMSAAGNVLYSCSPSAVGSATGGSGMIPLIEKSDLTISAMYASNSLHSLSSLAAVANGSTMGSTSHLLGHSHHHALSHHHHQQLGANEESESEQGGSTIQHDVKIISGSNGSHNEDMECSASRNSGGSQQQTAGAAADSIGVWRPY
ncbi:unnamed protein product [Orchesella dallaii]|uniref:Uncharacterized protein n=1 Tax=Orchesella dallaii TaxID=48710 RepID=A0ABP1RWQ1_9HEXA